MIFSFCCGDQLGDVVITESAAQPKRARLRPVSFCRGRRQDFIESDSKGGVDDFFKRLV